MKKIGFLSFGHWTPSSQSQTRSASDALLQSIDLAVAAEELGADGAYFRVHHFARQLGSPFPLLAAVGARTGAETAQTGAQTAKTASELAQTKAEQAAQAGGFVVSPTTDVSGTLDLSSIARNTIAHRRVVGNITGINLPTAAYDGQMITLVLTQDATGSRTLALPATILTAYGLDPVLSTAPGSIDVLHLWRDGVRWWGFVGAYGGA